MKKFRAGNVILGVILSLTVYGHEVRTSAYWEANLGCVNPWRYEMKRDVDFVITDRWGFESLSEIVNDGRCEDGVVIYVDQSVDVGEDFVPIGTETHPFNATLKGRGKYKNIDKWQYIRGLSGKYLIGVLGPKGCVANLRFETLPVRGAIARVMGGGKVVINTGTATDGGDTKARNYLAQIRGQRVDVCLAVWAEPEGSAVILTKNYVATNWHVVKDQGTVWVKSVDGSRISAKKVKSNPARDIVILKLDAPLGIKPCQFNTENLKVSTPMLTINRQTGSFHYGAVTPKIDYIVTYASGQRVPNVFKASASAPAGNSGGPAFILPPQIVAMASGRKGNIKGIFIPIKYVLEEFQEYLETTGETASLWSVADNVNFVEWLNATNENSSLPAAPKNNPEPLAACNSNGPVDPLGSLCIPRPVGAATPWNFASGSFLDPVGGGDNSHSKGRSGSSESSSGKNRGSGEDGPVVAGRPVNNDLKTKEPVIVTLALDSKEVTGPEGLLGKLDTDEKLEKTLQSIEGDCEIVKSKTTRMYMPSGKVKKVTVKNGDTLVCKKGASHGNEFVLVKNKKYKVLAIVVSGSKKVSYIVEVKKGVNSAFPSFLFKVHLPTSKEHSHATSTK
ncbi:MAG: serine protease [Oscillospiraceae bacterium]|nr:serine protease [Oscillospiraceae bacterium]